MYIIFKELFIMDKQKIDSINKLLVKGQIVEFKGKEYSGDPVYPAVITGWEVFFSTKDFYDRFFLLLQNKIEKGNWQFYGLDYPLRWIFVGKPHQEFFINPDSAMRKLIEFLHHNKIIADSELDEVLTHSGQFILKNSTYEDFILYDD